jgi:type II secretory pathway pseudopilin PulG
MNFNLSRLPKRKNQKGYTMLELLLVIGIIIALASIMIYAFLSRANKQAGIDTAAAQVSNIVISERASVRENGKIIAIDSDTAGQPLLTFGLQERIANTSTTANPWGGSYVVASIGGGQFTVQLNGLPKDMVGKTTQYQNFVNMIQRLGEGDQDKSGTKCTQTGNAITCTFDNQ